MPFRILHVIPAVAERYGGPSRAVVSMCRALMALGHQVELATSDADGDGRLDVPIGVPTDFEGIPTTFFPRVLGDGFKYSPQLGRWLRRETGRFDVVHVHAVFSYSSLSSARAARRAGVPYVLRPLGSLGGWALEQKALRKRVLMGAGVRLMIASAAAIHYTSRAEQLLAEQAVGPTPGVVIPLGVDDALLETPARPAIDRDAVVLALTRLHPVKNLEGLICGFGEAVRQPGLESWQLVVAGDGEPAYRRRLETLVRSQDLSARVTFTGWLDKTAKLAWLDRAAVLAQPSHQENFGIALVEALARGVPVLVTPTVNIADDISEAGAGWVSGGTPEAVATALRAAMSDDEARHARASAARALAERFRWARVARQIGAAYASTRSDWTAVEPAVMGRE